MNSRWLAALLIAAPASVASLAFAEDKPALTPAAAPAATVVIPDDINAQFSYAQGVQMGKQLSGGKEVGLDAEQFIKGIVDGSKGKADVSAADLGILEMKWVLSRLDKDIAKAELAKDTGQVTMAQEQKKMYQAELARREQGLVQAKQGEEFLKKNKSAEGVKTTASGLQYKVVKEGTGAKPGPNDTFTAHYKGTLVNGEVFDQSKPEAPLTLGVGQVIPGWTEGLQLMPVGSKYIFWIPSELGYGERGAGAKIPPNSVLVFEVELLKSEASAPQGFAPGAGGKGKGQ